MFKLFLLEKKFDIHKIFEILQDLGILQALYMNHCEYK